MPNGVTVARAFPAAATAGSTFEADLRAAMWRRARAALAVGVVISALMNVLARHVLQRPEPLDTPYTFLIPNVYLAYIGIFGFGLLLVWRDWWTARTVAFIVLGVWIASGLLDVSVTAVLYPDEQVAYGAALFLFIAAALLPWPLAFQVTLGLVFTLLYPVAATVYSPYSSISDSFKTK